MNFNPARHPSASQTNFMRLRAVHVAWPHSKDRRFGKTSRRGRQPPQIRFGRKTTMPKTENEP
jgi:hypothetical protein